MPCELHERAQPSPGISPQMLRQRHLGTVGGSDVSGQERVLSRVESLVHAVWPDGSVVDDVGGVDVDRRPNAFLAHHEGYVIPPPRVTVLLAGYTGSGTWRDAREAKNPTSQDRAVSRPTW